MKGQKGRNLMIANGIWHGQIAQTFIKCTVVVLIFLGWAYQE